MVEGLPMLKNEYATCEGCALGKMHKDEFPYNIDRRNKYLLELVHTDVCGVMHTRSLEGAYFFCYLLMNAQDTHGFISLGKRVMFLNTSRNLKTWWRSKQENPSKSSTRIKGDSTDWGT
jgi:hypothetical protein